MSERYYLGHYNYYGSDFGGLGLLWFIFIVAGAILLYGTFLHPKNEGKFTGFLGVLYDILSFKKIILETVLRIFYLIAALAVTIGGLRILFSASFVGGLLMLLMGNILVRVIFEASLIILIICRNTTEINRKLGGKTDNISFDAMAKEIPVNSIVSSLKSAGEKIRNSSDSHSDQEKGSSQPMENGKKRCESCGYELEEDDLFCPNCGTKSQN